VWVPRRDRERIRRGYAGSVALVLDEPLDRLSRVGLGEFSDFGNTARAATRVAGSGRVPIVNS
jgi:hypothetical protein